MVRAGGIAEKLELVGIDSGEHALQKPRHRMTVKIARDQPDAQALFGIAAVGKARARHDLLRSRRPERARIGDDRLDRGRLPIVGGKHRRPLGRQIVGIKTERHPVGGLRFLDLSDGQQHRSKAGMHVGVVRLEANGLAVSLGRPVIVAPIAQHRAKCGIGSSVLWVGGNGGDQGIASLFRPTQIDEQPRQITIREAVRLDRQRVVEACRRFL